MHSPDLVSSRLQTLFGYPRQQRSKNALYICVSLSVSTMKGLFFPRHVSQGQSGMFVHHKCRRKKRQIWYMENRMKPAYETLKTFKIN